MTPEQKEIMKEYTRGMQRRHNRENALLSRKRVPKKSSGCIAEAVSRRGEYRDETAFLHPIPPYAPIKDYVHPQHAVF